jgi:hypothetical protein
MSRKQVLRAAACLCAASLMTMTAPTRQMRAQSPSAVQEPEYINQFFKLGPEGKLVPLEQQKFAMETKSSRGFMSNSVASERTVPGPSSPVRVAPDSHFIVKMSAGNMDPSTLIALKPLTVEKKDRALLVAKAKGSFVPFAGGVKSQTPDDNSIAVSVKKYGDGSFEIVPQQPLPPGEYVLATNSGMMGVSCFGVDAAAK